MIADIIFVTKNPDQLYKISEYAARERRRIFIVDVGLQSIIPFPDKCEFIIRKRKQGDSLVRLINQVIFACSSDYAYIISDETLECLSGLFSLEKVIETIPRVASLRGSSTPGLIPVPYNELFGTLYARRVLQSISMFDARIIDLSLVAYSWGKEVLDRGWLHMSSYVEFGNFLPPSVSPIVEEDSSSDSLDIDRFIVPSFSASHKWHGVSTKRPWHYKVTVVIPHYGNHLRLLFNVIESWRMQSLVPYIMIYDMGTPSKYHDDFKMLEFANTEVHFLRYHGVRNQVDYIARAFDHGITDCRTDYLIFTHNDTIPVYRGVVEDLIRMAITSGVVGYGLNDPSQDKLCIGSRLTCANCVCISSVGARWRRPPVVSYNNPADYFSGFSFSNCLQNAGIVPNIIGEESCKAGSRNIHYQQIFDSFNYFSGTLVSDDLKSIENSVIRETEQRLLTWRDLSSA